MNLELVLTLAVTEVPSGRVISALLALLVTPESTQKLRHNKQYTNKLTIQQTTKKKQQINKQHINNPPQKQHINKSTTKTANKQKQPML